MTKRRVANVLGVVALMAGVLIGIWATTPDRPEQEFWFTTQSGPCVDPPCLDPNVSLAEFTAWYNAQR